MKKNLGESPLPGKVYRNASSGNSSGTSAKTLLSWSSGKDSAWALHVLRRDPAINLVGLFTVMNRKYDRASMHATRMELLHLQASAAGLPLQVISLPDSCSNAECDAIMGSFVADCADRGITHMAFGDLYLEDIRQYREGQLKFTGIEPVFPLWGIPTETLAREMLMSGVEAYVSSVDLKKLPSDFVGKKWSEDLIEAFPEGCDPCGENGEIHTIVTGGPMFRHAILVRAGKVIERDGFAYADIIPL